ncbi:MAG: recombination protein RecR [Eubacteriaceae bacterium]|jgi:recombination protein RecR|nr:recombination protein RecR [Eubacteriaceae bacterium]
MSYYIQPLKNLITEFAKMPGIGRKSAQRLAYYVLSLDDNQALALARAIEKLKEEVHLCPKCFNITDLEVCEICTSPKREQSTVCVVENPKDIIAIEKTREYRGLYHVLHGVISPMDGVGPEDIKVKELLVRLGEVNAEEVILAMNPNIEGEATAMYLSRLIKPLGIKVTRLARGIPMGGELEFADEYTLVSALKGRVEI